MRILAIDPAARTGWAFSATKVRVEASGVWTLASDGAARAGAIAARIRQADEQFQIETIAYEAATYGSRNPHVMRRHNELAGAIQAVCAELGIDCWEFGIGTWKARAVGKGNAKKPAVMRGLRMFYGIDVNDEDQADACGILLAAQQGPPPESVKKVRKRERKAMAKLPRLF
jgi:Holliday junction resolvasome RuvABC endonuclease subunit